MKYVAWAKTEAEVTSLEARGVRMAGCAFAKIVFVKGTLNAKEAQGAAPLSGDDGAALFRAVTTLGYAPQDWAALLGVLWDGTPLTSELLREAVEVLSPHTLVATDDEARRLLCETYASDLTSLEDLSQAILEPGAVVRVAGLRMMSLGGFEAALGDPKEKQRMWSRLKRVAPLGEPY